MSTINGKIIIKTDLTVLTGLHIGSSDAYSAIGTVDSPVIKSSKDGKPIIPGSSLKGKLRSLLAAVTPSDYKPEKNDKKIDYFNKDHSSIKKLFGSSAPIKPARLQFSDAYVCDKTIKLSNLTEVKFENTINRGNCMANPRQIERVVPGIKFETVIVYNIEENSEAKRDMEMLAKGFKLLQLDYLGGHGSRGSGRVSFNNFNIEVIENDTISSDDIKTLFKEVEEYELLHI